MVEPDVHDLDCQLMYKFELEGFFPGVTVLKSTGRELVLCLVEGALLITK
jgi:hypothetical protein